MEASLGRLVERYTLTLQDQSFRTAYRAIVSFLSELKRCLEKQYPDYHAGAFYPGYLDMSYFSLTPPSLHKRSLKIAVVYLHESARFELWLSGVNRKVQSEYRRRLRGLPLDSFMCSEEAPGVDSILVAPLAEHPDFDHPDELQRELVRLVSMYIDAAVSLVDSCCAGAPGQ